MALNFPNSPTTGDVHSASNNLSYFFDGVKWISQGSYNTGTINAVKLDSLTSSFNGSLTTFNLTSNNVAVKPANAQSLMISLAGVILEPVTAYTINSAQGTITFASAPASNAAFFGIVYSRLPVEVITTNVSDGVITNAKIAYNAAIDQSKLNISDATTSASGFMSTNDKTKLDGIETSATADQTAAEIRTLVENALDSNVFTDADHTKLDSVEAGAKNDQTGSEIKSLYENESDTNAFTDAEKTKLSGIEASATADQTASEIVALLSGQNITTGDFTVTSATPIINLTETNANPDYRLLTDGGEFVIQNDQSGSFATKFKIQADGQVNIGSMQFYGSNNVAIPVDGAEFKIGAGDDLKLYHDGTRSYIKNVTDELRLLSNTIRLANEDNNESYISCVNNGAVEIRYDNVTRLETTSTGVTVSGDASTGTIIQGAFSLRDTSSSSDRIKWIPNSPYVLRWADNFKASFGFGDDLQIYHDGTISHIHDDTSSVLQITNNDLRLKTSGDEMMVRCIANGAVELNYDGSKKLETSNGGVTVTGTITGTTNLLIGGASSIFAENNLRFKSSGAAYIDHNTTGQAINFRVSNSSALDTTALTIASDGTTTINGGVVNLGTADSSSGHLNAFEVMTFNIDSDNDDTNRYFAFYKDGASGSGTELFKIEESGAATLTGSFTASGDLTANGGDITISGTEAKLKFTDSDNNPDYILWNNNGVFRIYDNTNSTSRLVVNTDGHIDITNNLDVGAGITGVSTSSVPALTAKGDGSSQDGYIQLNCSQNSHGVKIKAPPHSAAASYTLTLPDTNGSANQVLKTDGSGNLSWVNQSSGGGGSSIGGDTGVDFNDSVKARFGTGDDLEIYHGGTNSIIQNSTGDLYFKNTNNLFIQVNNTEAAIYARPNGAVELYHDNVKKLETASNGVTLNDGLLLDNATNAGRDIQWQPANDRLAFLDNTKATFGNSVDLQIYHDGTDSFIQNSTNVFRILGDNIQIRNSANNETGFKFAANGGVELYYDNSKKFEITSGGVLIANGNVSSVPAGNGTASGASLDTTGGDIFTGRVFIQGDNKSADSDFLTGINNNGSQLVFYDYSNAEHLLKFNKNGSTELNYNGSKKFETSSGGVSVTGNLDCDGIRMGDNDEIRLGAGDDLKIYHDGSNSIISDAGSGSLLISSNGSAVEINKGTSEYMARFITDGAVQLYYNNNKKLETYSDGIKVIGQEGTSSALQLVADDGDDNGDTWEIRSNQDDNDLTFKNNISGSSVDKLTLQNDGDLFTTGDVYLKNDSKKLKFGASDDLEIYHSGTASFISNITACTLLLQNEGNIQFEAKSGEDSCKMIPHGAVELYYDNNKKFETTSSGAQCTGYLKATGGSGFGFITEDNVKFSAGTGNDLQIYHDGTNSVIKNITGSLFINATSSEVGIKIIPNESVELYENGDKKLETTSVGISVTGNVDLTAELNLTGGSDAQRYIDAAVGTSALTFRGCTSGDANHQEMARFFRGGACELNHAGTKKLETASGGVTITGLLTTTAANLDSGEFGMLTASGTPTSRFMDFGFLNNSLNMRRTNGGEAGHTNFLTVASSLIVSGDLNDTSDEKLKKNIASIADGAIAIIKQLRPVTFDWIDENRNNNVSGFIAQEVKTVLPNLVYGTEYDSTLVDETKGSKGGIKSEGYSVNTVGITAHLTKALQEAIAKIEILETKVATLEAA